MNRKSLFFAHCFNPLPYLALILLGVGGCQVPLRESGTNLSSSGGRVTIDGKTLEYNNNVIIKHNQPIALVIQESTQASLEYADSAGGRFQPLTGPGIEWSCTIITDQKRSCKIGSQIFDVSKQNTIVLRFKGSQPIAKQFTLDLYKINSNDIIQNAKIIQEWLESNPDMARSLAP